MLSDMAVVVFVLLIISLGGVFFFSLHVHVETYIPFCDRLAIALARNICVRTWSHCGLWWWVNALKVFSNYFIVFFFHRANSFWFLFHSIWLLLQFLLLLLVYVQITTATHKKTLKLWTETENEHFHFSLYLLSDPIYVMRCFFLFSLNSSFRFHFRWLVPHCMS